jgi:RNA polymerase sigma factor (sigma-70 family)
MIIKNIDRKASPVELHFVCSEMSKDSTSEYTPSLSALRARDDTEWGNFFKHFFPIACHQARHSIGWLSSRDASAGVEDIAQEGMLAFFKRVVAPNSMLRHLDSPGAYLRQVVRFTASGYIQKAFAQKRGGKSFPHSLDQPVPSDNDPSSNDKYESIGTFNHSQEQFRNEVLDALNLLDLFDRKLLVDRYLVGYKQRELEKKYGKKSMGVVVSRALERARKIFEKNGLTQFSWEFPDSPTQYIEESEDIYCEQSDLKAESIIEGRLDVNGDGKVDMEDLREFRRKLIALRKDRGSLSEKEKKQLDINGDGIVDELDFIALGMAVLRAGISPEDGAKGIARGDLNGDGRIDYEDLRILRLQLDLQTAGQSLSQETISNLDIDGDGKLDENDFINLTMLVLANEAEDAQRVGLEILLADNPLLQKEFEVLRQQTKGFQSAFGANNEDAVPYTPSSTEAERHLDSFLAQVRINR